MKSFFLSLIFMCSSAKGVEIALSFDDAPMSTSLHFETFARTEALIEKLKSLQVPSVMIFANPCKREDLTSVVNQLKKYKDAGHFIANHTCSHPRLDDVDYADFAEDARKADVILTPLFIGQKFFRFPYLNEGREERSRDKMRDWLKKNDYRNGMVSIDNDDYIFSFKINQAKEQGKVIDYGRVKKLFLEHIFEAISFYDDLAIKILGYSPRHVLLLHETDATVMFIGSLVEAIRNKGWKIISIEEAYKDKIYQEQPKNTYANNGIISQIAMERTGERLGYDQFDRIKAELNRILKIQAK